MIEVLSKPADQIGIDDIKALIASEVPEGEQIEFKESLPAKGQTRDPWENGGDQIGNRAKDTILKEVVAFANAHGGALLLGIKESATKPPVATKISPIPRCADLAEKLKQVFRDLVEPQLPRLEVFAVPTDGQSGVIILRVGRSRLAPHRVTRTLVCPIRRSNSCEVMTMREIQDMTLNVSRGLERLESWLDKRSQRFEEEFKRLENPEIAYGLRFTALPVGEEVQFDRVFREGRLAEELEEPWRTVTIRNESHTSPLGDHTNYSGIRSSSWQPKLRAARQDWGHRDNAGPYVNQSVKIYREIHCDGLLEFGVVSAFERSDDTNNQNKQLLLSPDWLIVFLGNLAIWADRIRSQARAPTAEYALDVEIRAIGRPVTVVTGNAGPSWKPSSRPSVGETWGMLQLDLPKFPRYSLRDADAIPSLLESFNCDFWNSIGLDIGNAECTLAIQDWPS